MKTFTALFFLAFCVPAAAQSCWGCMHGCTTEQRMKTCGLTRRELCEQEQRCRVQAVIDKRDPERCRQFVEGERQCVGR